MVNNSPITPKQKAFLDYMGIPSTEALSKDEAAQKIDRINDIILDMVNNENELQILKDRLSNWNFNKLEVISKLPFFELIA